MTSPFVEPLPKRKRKKGPDDEIIKNVVVLKSSQVCEKDGVVLMPKTTLDMSEIKKLGQSRKIAFTKSTSSGDLQRKLEEKFPFLKKASGRFYCAKAVENRLKLDFCGDRCVWSGAFINKNITGNSALYIYCEEEKEGDSGHYSSDPDLPGAPVYGNCLVTTAPQGCKRFGSEPCPATEGPIDKETLRAVESQTCGTVRESDRNYRPFGQPEGVKTQVIEIEASACALTVGREAAEEEQIQDQNPNTWLLTLQPTLLLSDLPEQTNRFTLAPLLESLQVCCKDIEIQKPYDQASTETLTAKGSQRAQQNTSVTVGDSDNQESSSEDRSDSGFETCTTPQDTSRNRDSLLSNTNTTGSPEPDEYETNNDFEISEEIKDAYSFYPGTEILIWPINPHELPPIDHNLRSEENGQDTLSRNSQNNAGVEETNQDVAQEISHPQVEGDEPNHIFEQEQFDHGSESEETMQDTLSRNSQNNAGVEETNQDVVQEISHPQVEGDEPNHIFEQEQSHPQMDVEEPNQNVEQEQLVQKICPSSGPLEGGGDFQISLKEELPEHIQYGYVYFGNEQVALTKLNKLTLEGTIPAAQEPGVVKVRVFSDTDEFLGAADFEYKVTLKTVVFQVLQLDPDGLSELFALMRKHKRSSENQSSSAKQNSGQATGALNDSCQDRSSPEENTVMDDEYEDLAQHFQDLGKWLSEQSFHPIQSNTACSEDEENFKGNQQTCPQEREENYFADAENSSACTEAEEDLEGDQLSCTQERDENYFPNTEDYSSVSYETDSALSNSESWDESLKDSSLSFPWVNSRSDKSLETIPETESTQHSYKAANSKPDVSHEILAPMTEGFTSEDSIGNSHYVRSGVCLKWNTSFSESKKTKENSEKDDHNEKQDSSEEWASDRRTSHTWLASHDESQYQDDELLETLHTNAKPQSSKSIRSATSNQQSATHPGPITQEAAQSPLSNPLWNVDSKLNMAPPQCSDEEIHSAIIEGESLGSWFDLCENEDTGKDEQSRWEMSSIEPNKTDGGVGKDFLDSEEELSQEQRPFSEQGIQQIHLSLPDDTSVQSHCPEVENKESQDNPLCEAASNGHTDIVRLLIKNGADVNKVGEDNPLSKAAGNGHTDIVRLLIENGADVNEGGWDTPLRQATRNGYTDIVRLLIENGADVNKGGWNIPLCEAARNGHTDIVRLLIENRADVNEGWNIPLFGAARNGHTDIVRLLIENGADVNKEGLGNPLSEAARNGYTDIVRLLIENGADVNKEGWGNPLSEAARNGYTDIVRLLIENGADVNKGRSRFLLSEAAANGHTDFVRLLIENGADVNEGGWDTPLYKAAGNGYNDIVRLLIENGADVNKGRSILEDTPLAEATRNGYINIVRLLIENGADVNKRGWNIPLCEAARNGHTDIVRLLIEKGADFNGRWDNPLREAAGNGHTNIVRLLIENGADVNEGRWDTPLSQAARNGHNDIVRLLIENGADVNKGESDTPLCGAASNGHTDILRLLIENGADINKRGWDTPLRGAASNGHTDIVRLLIKNGADINKGGQDTPLSGAARNGHTDIARLLIENGADVNKRGWDTPLCEAARNGHTDIVRLLIENGVDVNRGWSDTPLAKAASNGHTDIVRLLIENGADVNRGWDTLFTEAVKNGHTGIASLLIENRADVNEGSERTINIEPLEERLRRKFVPGARLTKVPACLDVGEVTKVPFEREYDVQPEGKKTASLPKMSGKKLITQTEMTCPRDIVEEGECGRDLMTNVELGLSCLHLSPECEQFYPCIMDESPGDSRL